MRVSLSTEDGRFFAVEVEEITDLSVLRSMVEAETGIVAEQQVLKLHGRTLPKEGTVSSAGIGNDDMLVVSRSQPEITHISQIPMSITPDQLMQLVGSNQRLLGQFAHADAEMGDALRRQDIGKLRLVMMQRAMDQHRVGWERQREMQRIHENPDSEESQRKIAEAIRQEQLQANLEFAMENMPEAFGRVTMLYVDIEVNSQPIKAFVDSGAQSTIISHRMAEKCGLLRHMDTRFAGEARGVGTARILGRVLIAQMKLGNSFFPVSITVLENNDVDFLLGLDMLKRHQMVIDLQHNVLRVEGSSGIEEIPFLAEKDLPLNARGTTPDEVKMEEEAYHPPAAAATATAAAASSSSGPVAAAAPAPAPAAAESGQSDERTQEQKLQELLALGFPLAQCQQALEQAGGNVEFAANLLFASMN